MTIRSGWLKKGECLSGIGGDRGQWEKVPEPAAASAVRMTRRMVPTVDTVGRETVDMALVGVVFVAATLTPGVVQDSVAVRGVG